METFGALLRSRRKGRGLTQQELANLVGFSRNTISNWETSKYTPRYPDVVLSVAQALSLSNADTDLLLIAADFPPDYLEVQPDTTFTKIETAHVERMRVEKLEVVSLDEPGSKSLPISHAEVQRLFGPAVRLVDLDQFKPARDEEVYQYYGGSPLSWKIILANGDVERDTFNGFVERYSKFEKGVRMLCLVGKPGSGKSTLAWRIVATLLDSSRTPVLQLRSYDATEFWYQLEYGAMEVGKPLIVLVDDIFRSEEALMALETINPDLDIVIIASSRFNEVPLHLQLPFLVDFEKLHAPTKSEKHRVLDRMQEKKHRLTKASKKRLLKADSWLVMMAEAATGNLLSKIAYDVVKRLAKQDPVVYRAYGYLCYFGQYDLNIPISLMNLLDPGGYFSNLANQPAARGIVFEDTRHGGSLHTLHANYASEAWKYYYRDSSVLINRVIQVLIPDFPYHRMFFAAYIRAILKSTDTEFVREFIEQESSLIQNLLTSSSLTELTIFWLPIYRRIGQRENVLSIVKIALSRPLQSDVELYALLELAKFCNHHDYLSKLIDTALNWVTITSEFAGVRVALVKFLAHQGGLEQRKRLIQSTLAWLDAHPKDRHVRRTFLGLIENRGSLEQREHMILSTLAWLDSHPEDRHFRKTFLGFVERIGSPDQSEYMMQSTLAWLDAHPEDVEVRVSFLGFVERVGSPKQRGQLIQSTLAWLDTHPEDRQFRYAFLGFVERHGSPLQRSLLIQSTLAWLDAHPEDINVRKTFLGFVERVGSPEQSEDMMQSTLAWLDAHPEDINIRKTFLGFVERIGSPEQSEDMMQSTLAWLDAHPEETQVRATFLGFVERVGSPEQSEDMMQSTLAWLDAHPENINVHDTFLGFVERVGSPEQSEDIMQSTLAWLDAHPEDINVRKTFLGFVERVGSPEQSEDMMQSTLAWLDAYPEETQVRATFLGFVERVGSPEQSEHMMQSTLAWLDAHPEDINVRKTFLGFVERVGSPELRGQLIQSTQVWLDAHPGDVQVHLSLLRLVVCFGTVEQHNSIIQNMENGQKSSQTHLHTVARYLRIVATIGSKSHALQTYQFIQKWLQHGDLIAHSYLLVSYVKLAHRLEHYKEAELVMRKALRVNKRLTHVRILLAWSLYYQGKNTAALNEFRRVLWWAKNQKTYPLGAAYHHIGRYYGREGDYLQAEYYFERAKAVSPDRFGNYWELGFIHLAQGKPKNALQAFKDALERLPNNFPEKSWNELQASIDTARAQISKDDFD